MAKADSKDPVTQAANSSEKAKALAAALAQIEKQFGKGAIMKLGERGVKNIDVVSSGSLLLDQALGVGGFIFWRRRKVKKDEEDLTIDED